MILKDGTDTRQEWRRPGPYCDGLAVVLDRLDQDGGADDWSGDDGRYVARFGRRVLFVDSQGFMGSETFETVEDAGIALDR